MGSASDSASWEEVLSFGDEKKAVQGVMRWYADSHIKILRTLEAQGWKGDEDLHRRMLGVSMVWWMWRDRPDLQALARKELSKILRFDTEHGRDNLITILVEQIKLGSEIGQRTADGLQGLVAEGSIKQEEADALMKIYDHINDLSQLPRSED
jgi:hypothetical protein